MQRHGITAIASGALMAASSVLILLNKHLLANGFPFPMALAGVSMGFSGLASYLTCHVFKFVDLEPRDDVTPRFLLRRILPVGFFTAATLYLGNLAYLYLTVAFIQMLKATSPVITMSVLFAARMETPSCRLTASVCFIAIGAALASAGESRLNWIGVGIVALAESIEAVRLVMTQVLLAEVHFHPLEGLMYLGPASSAWLFFGSALVEARIMARSGAVYMVATHSSEFVAAAVLGFCVNALGYAVIQNSSSLTLKMVASVRNAFVVWVGYAFLKERVTALQAVGYSLSMMAFFWYTTIKMVSVGTTASKAVEVDDLESDAMSAAKVRKSNP